jgi:hypothetical protein
MKNLNSLNKTTQLKWTETLVSMLESYTHDLKYDAEEKNPVAAQLNRANDKMMRAAKLLLEAKQELG